MASTPTSPKPRKHHGRLVWRSRWYDDQGLRHDKLFGPVDEVTERQAKAAYNVWLTDWTLKDRVRNPQADRHTYRVEELATDYLAHAKRTFVKRGEMTTHVWTVVYGMQALIDHFPGRTAASIEPHELAALRDTMIWREEEGEDGKTRRVARGLKTVNGRLFTVKKAFLWAMERGLVPAETVVALNLVSRLAKGRSSAKDPVKVRPVDEHWVAVTKDYCASPVRAMIDLQWLTGMRPGEVVLMRPRDIDMSGQVWLYTPEAHKTEHLDKFRVVPLGPQAQAVIRPFLTRDVGAYLFSPAEAKAEKLADRRKAREEKGTPLYPSHLARYAAQRVERPRRAPGARYTEETYRRAVHYACRAADKAAKKKDPEAVGVPQWNPNQLRHAAATRLNRQFGLEEVSITLGHSDVRTTRLYADPDVAKAVEIARKVG